MEDFPFRCNHCSDYLRIIPQCFQSSSGYITYPEHWLTRPSCRSQLQPPLPGSDAADGPLVSNWSRHANSIHQKILRPVGYQGHFLQERRLQEFCQHVHPRETFCHSLPHNLDPTPTNRSSILSSHCVLVQLYSSRLTQRLENEKDTVLCSSCTCIPQDTQAMEDILFDMCCSLQASCEVGRGIGHERV